MTTHVKDSHCSWCGTAFPEEALSWPRHCTHCGHTSYKNPLPVAVALIPVKGGGLVGVRRGIPPRKGEVALPGGFIDVGESWQAACAREVEEELGLSIDARSITVHTVLSAPDGTVLIMGLTPEINLNEAPEFVPNDETMERLVIEPAEDLELAFPLHTEAVKLYFSRQ